MQLSTTKPTRADILPAEPQQLRMWVAEYILGINVRVSSEKYRPFIHREFLRVGETYYITADGYEEELPNYPADIGAAWAVSAHMLTLDNITVDWFHHHMRVLCKRTYLYEMTTQEAAATIIRAALLAGNAANEAAKENA